jgi:hypothetical protein
MIYALRGAESPYYVCFHVHLGHSVLVRKLYGNPKNAVGRIAITLIPQSFCKVVQNLHKY